MKDDLEVPQDVPKKRRALEGAPDLFLASWLARDDLTPSERKRVEAERASRKAKTNIVGFFHAPGHSPSPAQRAALRSALERATSAVHHEGREGGADRFHGIARHLGIQVQVLADERAVCDAADVILATPRESAPPPRRMDRSDGVWGMIRYAQRRGVRVKVIRPDGTEQGSSE